MKFKILSVCCLVIWVTVLSACSSNAAPTDQTAARSLEVAVGETIYSNHCTRCHGENLQGDIGPKLSVESLSNFNTAKDLYDFISVKMPLDNPGGLTQEQYMNVEAYILNKIGVLKPSKALTQDNLSQIQVK